MARCAVVASSVHAGWIGGKCRLASLTIASGFGEGIDGSYRGYRRSVFLNRARPLFLAGVTSRRWIFAASVGAQRSSLDLCRTTKPPLSKVAAFALGEGRCLFAIGTRAEL
jgi:hypothetical protein